MKEMVKNGILLFLIVVFAVLFITTKGNDELNFNINLDFSNGEEEFSYPVYASEYNGLYRNNKGNGVYAFVGKNADDTYRIYLLQAVKSVKTVLVKLDSISLSEKGEGTFIDTSNLNANDPKMAIAFKTNEFSLSSAELGISNAKLEGSFFKLKDINQFSMSEFEY